MSTNKAVTLALTIGTAFVGAVGATAAAATLQVPGDFATIQACIDAAVSGVDECVVFPGTYHETINFLGKAITLRSSGGAGVTTIDATGIGGSVVTCASGEGPDTVLDGFTITGGTGTNAGGYWLGGGMYNYYSSPTVTNCTFSGNSSLEGGGMANYNSAPVVHACTFSGNTAVAGGGGMFNHGGSAIVTNCTFSRNMASGGGGGMNNSSYSSPVVSNCTFNGNTAVREGGGMYNWIFSNPMVTDCTFSENTGSYGGGMYSYQSFSTVINSSTFTRNIADSGGALCASRSSLAATNCTFNGNTARGNGGGIFGGLRTVSGCTFSGNTAAFDGGAMYNTGPTVVTNCTFSGNTADNSAGGMYNHKSDPEVVNCILWGDTPEEIADSIQYTAPIIRFSDAQGGLPFGAVDGGGNIDLAPMFVRPPNPGPDGTWDGVDDDYGDLRLQAGSPGIDAGDPAFVAQPGETELEGHARVLCGRVDMGAYEFGIGDHDCDQSVNLTDFAGWALCMNGPQSGPYEAGCESFDFDGDGSVSLLDFSGFQRVFAP